MATSLLFVLNLLLCGPVLCSVQGSIQHVQPTVAGGGNFSVSICCKPKGAYGMTDGAFLEFVCLPSVTGTPHISVQEGASFAPEVHGATENVPVVTMELEQKKRFIPVSPQSGEGELRSAIFRNFPQFFRNCFLLFARPPRVLVGALCVSPVQRCCSLRLRELGQFCRIFCTIFSFPTIFLQFSCNFPAIFRNWI